MEVIAMVTPRTSHILVLVVLTIVLTTISVVGQMDWTKLSPTLIPSARFRHAMAYDEARQRVVLFGGVDSNLKRLNDTWEWDGSSWIPCKPNTSPSARFSAMAYDSARKRVVLFGGGSVGQLNDTWEWDGTNWTDVTPAVSPPARVNHDLAYDGVRKSVVLFGGYTGKTWLNDTWGWDGRTWTQYKPTTSPPVNAGHAMAYDSAGQRIVLFGGGQPICNNTWEWDGRAGTWKNVTPSGMNPPVRNMHAMAYDAARQRIVLFSGGYHPSYHADTWEWGGISWIQCSPTTKPPKLGGHGMAYDAARGNTVLFGGHDGTNIRNDTWVYGPTDLTASSHLVSVATGGNVTLSIDAGTGHNGKSYFLAGCMDSGAPRGMPLGNVTLLLNPDGYFWFTVYSPNSLIANSLGVLDGSGKATATVKVPKGLSPVLIGLRFYHAYIVFLNSIDYSSTPVPLTLRPH